MIRSNTSTKLGELLTSVYQEGKTLGLFFDFDGTLAPIVPLSSQAQMSERMNAQLNQLVQLDNIKMGVLSGRSLEDLKSRVDIPKTVFAGSGGMEIDFGKDQLYDPKGGNFWLSVERIVPLLERIIEDFPGTRLEKKPYSFSLHFRGLSPSMATGFQAYAIEILRSCSGIRYREVCQSIEVQLHKSWDKGIALDHICRYFDNDMFLAYFGDDLNDTEALEYVNKKKGAAIGIGDHAPIIAKYYLESPRQLHKFLDDLYSDLKSLTRKVSLKSNCRSRSRGTKSSVFHCIASDDGDDPEPKIHQLIQQKNILCVGFLDSSGFFDPALISSDMIDKIPDFYSRVDHVNNLIEVEDMLYESASHFSLVLVDLRLKGLEAVNILNYINTHFPNLPCIACVESINFQNAMIWKRNNKIPLLPLPLRWEALVSALHHWFYDHESNPTKKSLELHRSRSASVSPS